tara:strand:+ start:15860 stop:16291 length:432 start_codon:yes stop_codon:yes gene_type:complete
MGWGTAGNIVTTNLDAGSDNPASARPNLKAALDEITAIINGRDAASGVAGLSASSKIVNTQLPDTIISSSSTDLTLTPNTGCVNINSVIQLNPQTKSALYARSDLADGMLAVCDTSDSTIDGLVLYAGGVWRRVSDNTELPAS